ncbi:MAG: hypothetical protein ACTSPB_03415 [Candidatus Thorarchaeota archaeon]
MTEGHTPALSGGQVDLSPSFVVESSTLKGAEFIAPNVGSATVVTATIGGTYAVGDVVRLTLTSNDESTQKWRKSYRHTVQVNATAVNDVAAALGAQIERDGQEVRTPYTASTAGAVITITAKTDDKNALVGLEYVNSAAGTIVLGGSAAVISEGQPSDLVDRGVDPADINLAQYDTVRIKYEPTEAVPNIDNKTPKPREIFWYGTPGEGSALATLINGL